MESTTGCWLIHTECDQRAFMLDRVPALTQPLNAQMVVKTSKGRPIHPGQPIQCPNCDTPILTNIASNFRVEHDRI